MAGYASPDLDRGVCVGAHGTSVGAARRWWARRWRRYAGRRLRRARWRRTLLRRHAFWRHAFCFWLLARIQSLLKQRELAWFFRESWIPLPQCAFPYLPQLLRRLLRSSGI